jgi:pimeloyl-ACP methyl ester carboxylesterase
VIVEANGLAFHVQEAGSGDRLALCLHGFPETSHSWRHQLPVLADLGYRAWAPDLRGYGATRPLPASTDEMAVERHLDDVDALLDAAGAETATIVGHDWGAIISWLYAMRRPERVDRLVIMNVPHPAAFERNARANPRQWLRSWYALFFQLPWLPERALTARRAEAVARAFEGVLPEDDVEVYRRAMLQPGAVKAAVDIYRAFLRGGGLARQRRLGWPTITCPTLVIWGVRDVALGEELLDGTERWVADLRVEKVEATHWVQQDAPDVVNAHLRRFCE